MTPSLRFQVTCGLALPCSPRPPGPQNPPSPICVPVLAAGLRPHLQLVWAAWGPGQASALPKRCCLKPLDSALAAPPTLSPGARIRPSLRSGAGNVPGGLRSCSGHWADTTCPRGFVGAPSPSTFQCDVVSGLFACQAQGKQREGLRAGWGGGCRGQVHSGDPHCPTLPSAGGVGSGV